MDFQSLVDSFAVMACVVSVENKGNGEYGKFRIVTGNDAYVGSIEHPGPGVRMLKDKFIPNTEYTDYLTRDLNFEHFCYRAAVEKKMLHSYAHPERMNVWFDMTFFPLSYEDGELCYCIYTMEVNLEADTGRMSNISAALASAVLEASLKLRASSDFRSGMNDIIGDIRELCSAEYCCIMLMDHESRSCDVLCESIKEGSGLLSMETYNDEHFYDIAETWEDTIAGSNCLIVKNAADMEVVKERNPVWHKSLTEAGADSIVLFPLKSRNDLIGYIWAIDFDPDESEKIKETFELATFILSSEISNHMLLNRLTVLSSTDMLTGVMNRNEMNNIVDRIAEGEYGDGSSAGVIFADVNGLKRINDTEGHDAGDRLIKNAAASLCDVFSPGNIYRAGGDEFTVILPDVTDADLERMIDDIRTAASKREGLSIAIGGCTVSDSRDIRRALTEADQRMYEDKKRHYSE